MLDRSDTDTVKEGLPAYAIFLQSLVGEILEMTKIYTNTQITTGGIIRLSSIQKIKAYMRVRKQQLRQKFKFSAAENSGWNQNLDR